MITKPGTKQQHKRASSSARRCGGEGVFSYQSGRQEGSEAEGRSGIFILLSLFIHALVIFAIFWLLVLSKQARPRGKRAVEVTILQPEQAQRRFIDSRQATVTAAQPPPQAAFESDQDTLAASEVVGRGDPSLPSLEGHEDEESLALRDQHSSTGPDAVVVPPSAAAQPRQAVEPTESEQVRPEQQKVAPTKPEEEQEAEAQERPLLVDPKRAGELTRMDPTRAAKPVVEQPDGQQVSKPVRPVQNAQQAQVARAPRSSYQPETRVTRLQGGISNRGKASIAAKATPLGRYHKLLSDAVGSRWYYYVRGQLGTVSPGTAKISFVVKPDGSVDRVRVLSNSSNEVLASVSVQSIIEAEIPPIPEEVVRVLGGQGLEVDYVFTLY